MKFMDYLVTYDDVSIHGLIIFVLVLFHRISVLSVKHSSLLLIMRTAVDITLKFVSLAILSRLGYSPHLIPLIALWLSYIKVWVQFDLKIVKESHFYKIRNLIYNFFIIALSTALLAYENGVDISFMFYWCICIVVDIGTVALFQMNEENVTGMISSKQANEQQNTVCYFPIFVIVAGTLNRLNVLTGFKTFFRQNSIYELILIIYEFYISKLKLNNSVINKPVQETLCSQKKEVNIEPKLKKQQLVDFASFEHSCKLPDNDDCDSELSYDSEDKCMYNEVLEKLEKGKIKVYNLETEMKSFTDAVRVRRMHLVKKSGKTSIENIPYKNYPYKKVYKQCCENVVGYISIPVGLAGPCVVNDKTFYVPLSTTEGCLIASINRGFASVRKTGGIKAFITDDGMTRCPILKAPNSAYVISVRRWLEIPVNFSKVRLSFNSTSNYAKLVEIKPIIAGKLLFLRYKATTGDAMGMNMISKGVDQSLKTILEAFPKLETISLSGNLCSDKKSAAINWISGRGKSVTCEAVVDYSVLKNVLKIDDVDRLVEVHNTKNFIGSALAGSIGGFNAHAANSVAAIFAASGQDLGQIVESSSCITILSKHELNDLYISCTMPSIEVGTVGGGTILPTQRSCLEIMNCFDESIGKPSEILAMLICSTVLAGELSLLSSLCEGTLVKSHMSHNRSINGKLSYTSNLEKLQEV